MFGPLFCFQGCPGEGTAPKQYPACWCLSAMLGVLRPTPAEGLAGSACAGTGPRARGHRDGATGTEPRAVSLRRLCLCAGGRAAGGAAQHGGCTPDIGVPGGTGSITLRGRKQMVGSACATSAVSEEPGRTLHPKSFCGASSCFSLSRAARPEVPEPWQSGHQPVPPPCRGGQDVVLSPSGAVPGLAHVTTWPVPNSVSVVAAIPRWQ